MADKLGYQSFMRDLAALVRRKAQDVGRSSLFENVSPGNVGNVFEIGPSPPEFQNAASQAAFGRPVRVLEVVGEDALGEMLCVSIQQETVSDRIVQSTGQFPIPGLNDILEGPLVGIVEFGAGAGISTFEFDIPAPRSFPGLIDQFAGGVAGRNLTDLSVARRVGGVMLTLPASSMRIFIRNDANAPFLININNISQNPPSAGNSPISINALNKQPALVRVHATYGRRPFQAYLTRSYPVCLAQTTNGAGPTTGFFAQTSMTISIPPYARRVFFPRYPLSDTSLQVQFTQAQITATAASMMFTQNFVVPAGSIGGLDIQPFDTHIRFTNPLGGTTIENMFVVFELAI